MTAATVSVPAVTVGVLKEAAPGEQRVAVVPESLAELARAQVQVLVEPGAGTAAWFGDDEYEQAGAQIVGLDELVARADVLVTVGEPPPS